MTIGQFFRANLQNCPIVLSIINNKKVAIAVTVLVTPGYRASNTVVPLAVVPLVVCSKLTVLSYAKLGDVSAKNEESGYRITMLRSVEKERPAVIIDGGRHGGRFLPGDRDWKRDREYRNRSCRVHASTMWQAGDSRF